MILPLSIDLAIDLEDLKVFVPLMLIVISLAIGLITIRIAERSTGRDTPDAGDPYLFPIGDAPTLPHQIYPRELE